jgi:tetratricopeptide (TPR) repeat protein
MNVPRFLRVIFVSLLVLVCLLSAYGLAFYMGVQSGREAQTELTAVEQAVELERQIDIAQADLLRGNYQLAIRRLDWVLEQDPGNAAARQLRQEAETALAAPPRPAGNPTATPVESVPEAVLIDPGIAENGAAAVEFGRLQRLADDAAWPDLIPQLLDFQRTYPNHQRRQTNELLFNAYTTYGVDLLYTDNVELGLFYLRQAELLGDLPQEVADQKLWAELFLGGLSFYEVEWETSILFFRELCPAAPFFQNACDRLVTALVALGDQNAARGEWCPAEPLYAEAYQQDNRTEIADKLALARQGCANATPTPSTTITGTQSITGTAPITNTAPITPTQPPQIIIDGP